MVESNLDHQMITHYCSVEWLTTYSNLDECVLKLHNDDRNAASLVKTSYFKSYSLFLLYLRGCSYNRFAFV